MKRDIRLLFGPLAALIFALGVAGLAMTVPGYDSVRQTVSEIGAVVSPAQIPFSVMLWIVAASVAVFALGLHRASLDEGCSPWAAHITFVMAVCAAGIGAFAFPHPLHNVFGIAELIAYQAPVVFALTWRRNPDARGPVVFSWIMTVVVWTTLVLALSTLTRQSALWLAVQPYYGLVQRSLFAAFFLWCGGLGWILWRRGEP